MIFKNKMSEMETTDIEGIIIGYIPKDIRCTVIHHIIIFEAIKD